MRVGNEDEGEGTLRRMKEGGSGKRRRAGGGG